MQSYKVKLISTICIIFGAILLSLSFKNNLQTKKLEFNETKIESSISEQSITKEIEDLPINYQSELKKGLDFIKDHNYRLAISHFVQANKIDSTQALPFLLSAESYLYLDKPELAKKNIYAASYKEQYGLYGKIVELQYYIYARKNNNAVALLESLPNKYAEVQFWHAIYALNTHDIQTATKIFKNLTQTQENNPYFNTAKSFNYNLKLFYSFQDSPTNFLQTLTAKNLLNENHIVAARLLNYTSLKQNPAFRDAWLSLGYSFVKVREYKKALQTLEKTRKLDPYNADTHLYLGITYYNLKNFTNALRHLKLAVSFETKHKTLAKEFLAHCMYEKNEPNTKQIITELINENHLTPLLLSNLTQLHLEENNLDQAATTLQLFKNSFQNHNLYFYNLGNLFFKTKNYAKSLQNLELSLKLNPTSSQAMYLIAMNHKRLDNTQTYTKSLNTALSMATKVGNKNIYQKILNELQND